MVLLAAAICSKEGKALVSRQFVEMSKIRIEGLIATFPKLINSGKQHTFIETDSVRYVYQPLEKLYVLLITTKASNILEDLETLRLFARVIPEYAGGTDESDVLRNSFELIFAFDEIIALGYRENVNINQIRVITEMKSQDELLYKAIRDGQEREAKLKSKEMARELHQNRVEQSKRGSSGGIGLVSLSGLPNIGGGGGMGKKFGVSMGGKNSSFNNEPVAMSDSISKGSNKTSNISSGGMQLGGESMGMSGIRGLGGNSADIASGGGSGLDAFVDQLRAEGENIGTEKVGRGTIGNTKKLDNSGGSTGQSGVAKEDLHLRFEEKINLSARRDGSLMQAAEVTGILQLAANSERAATARLKVDTSRLRGSTTESRVRPATILQTHPHIDKNIFNTKGILQTRSNTGKSFPVGTEVGVLKWRLQSNEDSFIPFTVNCWPNEIEGGFEVNIECELVDTSLELHNVCIIVPLPVGINSPPNISTCESGDYKYIRNDPRVQCGCLEWSIPVVDMSNSNMSLEFVLKCGSSANTDAFFPVNVEFSSPKLFSDVEVTGVTDGDEAPMKFSSQTEFKPDKYEFV